MDDAEIIAVTSELTVAEVLVKPFRDGNIAGQRAFKTFLQPTPAFQIIPISRDLLEEAAALRAATRLKLPDRTTTPRNQEPNSQQDLPPARSSGPTKEIEPI